MRNRAFPYPRRSWILDSLGRGFRITGTGFQSLPCQWNWDSGFQSLVGFRIPKAVFRIPKPRIPHFLTLGDPNLGAKWSQVFSKLSIVCLVPRRLSFDENVRAKEGGKETTGETSGRSCFQDGGKSNGGPICNF